MSIDNDIPKGYYIVEDYDTTLIVGMDFSHINTFAHDVIKWKGAWYKVGLITVIPSVYANDYCCCRYYSKIELKQIEEKRSKMSVKLTDENKKQLETKTFGDLNNGEFFYNGESELCMAWNDEAFNFGTGEADEVDCESIIIEAEVEIKHHAVK